MPKFIMVGEDDYGTVRVSSQQDTPTDCWKELLEENEELTPHEFTLYEVKQIDFEVKHEVVTKQVINTTKSR